MLVSRYVWSCIGRDGGHWNFNGSRKREVVSSFVERLALEWEGVGGYHGPILVYRDVWSSVGRDGGPLKTQW